MQARRVSLDEMTTVTPLYSGKTRALSRAVK